jgi:hypothetical protein
MKSVGIVSRHPRRPHDPDPVRVRRRDVSDEQVRDAARRIARAIRTDLQI